DFEVAADWKDIPVVYGLLNIGDKVHYIRVEKAFLDPDGNALDIAQIADSLYYDNAKVFLERESDGQVFELQRVDGKSEGYPREPGVFAEEPNWLYKIDSSVLLLKPKESIRLRIDRGNGLPEVTARTLVLTKLKLRRPDPTNTNSFNFAYNLPTEIQWSSDDSTKVFDVNFIFRYAEFPADNPNQVEEKTVEWQWARGYRPPAEGLIVHSLEKELGEEFYQVLKNNIPVNSILKRVFLGIDVVITGGGDSLNKYVNVAESNTGITGAQEIPTYTNLSEGRGVFSSISKLVQKNVQLTQATRDSLRLGIHTKQLNF
ncbi:MAG: hypothetical protein AAB316_24790, partial [Bacteroidota bacterium]